MRKFKPFLLSFLFLVGSFIFFPTKALALDFAGLSLSPPTFELSANPGDTLENAIKVENLTNAPLKLVVDRRNFTAIGEEGSVGLTEEQTSFSLASWIAVIPAEVEMPPKSTQIFTFKISVPSNAEPGGHFGSIVFRTGSTTPTQSGAALVQELGSLVLLRVAGKTAEAASLESFSPKKYFWEYGPIEFDLRIKNEGNVHVKPQGTIIITNFLGKKIGSGVVELEPKNVLPGSVRKNSVVWGKKLLFGKYTAVASLVYGTQGEILTASTTFFAFPYKIGGIIFAVLLVIFLLMVKARRRLKVALRILLKGK